MPKGAFYIYADIRSTGMTSDDFAVKLLNDYGVACVPGNAFGRSGEGFVRMSYATSMENIKIAAGRIAQMVRR